MANLFCSVCFEAIGRGLDNVSNNGFKNVPTSQKLDLGLISTRLKIALLNFTCPGQRSEIPSQSYHSIQKDCSYNY